MTPIPDWCQPAQHDHWLTQPLLIEPLHVSLALPQHWQHTPEIKETPMEISQVYRGVFPSDLLLISHIPQANPKDNITNWVQAFMMIAGFPILELIANPDNPPQLLWWQDEGANPELAARLGVDITHVFEGFATLPGDEKYAARLYMLLARRGTWAWKIALSIESACYPGTSEDMIRSNDHVRAGAVLGNLVFLA